MNLLKSCFFGILVLIIGCVVTMAIVLNYFWEPECVNDDDCVRFAAVVAIVLLFLGFVASLILGVNVGVAVYNEKYFGYLIRFEIAVLAIILSSSTILSIKHKIEHLL
eukprot:TRINITY_DN2907_c0_g1_i10.p1 TRINITY_DN2907_c0_g1~~TRINITY_DN2907_c0_g1_i10.p1  ORF type:complete len:108 (+),score=5.57 TRINITY_DN2907_c0_g1_i10:364-687(+)